MKFTVAEYEEMVSKLWKPPEDILKELTLEKLNRVHAAMGVCGEAGELLDATKKFLVYNKPEDRENIIEEMGDIEFYLAELRQQLGVTRNTVLQANVDKLNRRYAEGRFSNKQAQTRADKVIEHADSSYTTEEIGR